MFLCVQRGDRWFLRLASIVPLLLFRRGDVFYGPFHQPTSFRFVCTGGDVYISLCYWSMLSLLFHWSALWERLFQIADWSMYAYGLTSTSVLLKDIQMDFEGRSVFRWVLSGSLTHRLYFRSSVCLQWFFFLFPFALVHHSNGLSNVPPFYATPVFKN